MAHRYDVQPHPLAMPLPTDFAGIAAQFAQGHAHAANPPQEPMTPAGMFGGRGGVEASSPFVASLRMLGNNPLAEHAMGAGPYTQSPTPPRRRFSWDGEDLDTGTPEQAGRSSRAVELGDVTAENGEPLTGSRLGAVCAEVGRRYDIDMAQAACAVDSLKRALDDTWRRIEEAAAEAGDKEKAKTKIGRQLGRVADLEGLFEGDGAAQECIEAIRQGLRLLEGIADEAIQDSAGELAAEKRNAVALRDVLKPVGQQQTVPSCGICYSNPVDRVCMPCGHTACGRCSNRQQGSCFFCRGRCTVSNLYFSG